MLQYFQLFFHADTEMLFRDTIHALTYSVVLRSPQELGHRPRLQAEAVQDASSEHVPADHHGVLAPRQQPARVESYRLIMWIQQTGDSAAVTAQNLVR